MQWSPTARTDTDETGDSSARGMGRVATSLCSKWSHRQGSTVSERKTELAAVSKRRQDEFNLEAVQGEVARSPTSFPKKSLLIGPLFLGRDRPPTHAEHFVCPCAF